MQCACATVLVITSFCLQARICAAQELRDGLRGVLAAWDHEAAPGLVVSVVRGDEAVVTEAVGLAHLEHGVAITGRTVFHAASVSKQITGAAVLLLERDGALSLDDDVRTHLPELPDLGSEIRLRHLLWHTSGLRDQWQVLGAAGWREDDVVTDAHVWRAMLRQRELNFPPGTREMYCNTGYTLLAKVVERVSGDAFGVFCERELFGPLGMASTRFQQDVHAVVPGRAESYVPAEGGGWRRFGLSFGTAGATGLLTTAEDLALWAGELMSGRVLGDGLVERLGMPGVLDSGEPISYGMGLFVGEDRGVASVGHPGADSGFRASVRCYPEHGLGVVVLANRSDVDVWGLPTEIASLVIGELVAGEPERGGGGDPNESARAGWQGTYRAADGRAFQVLDRYGRLEVWEAGSRVRGAGALSDDGSLSVASLGWYLRVVRRGDGRVSDIVLLTGEDGASASRVESLGSPDDFAGRYRSEELDTTYELVARGGGVLAAHFRNEPAALSPVLADVYGGGPWYFREIELVRGVDGAVRGFLLHNSRARNIWFRRQ